MKVTVDQDICASSGNCVMNAPEVFDQRDDDGAVVLLKANPPPAHSGGAPAVPPPPVRRWPYISRNEKNVGNTDEYHDRGGDPRISDGQAGGLPVRPAAGRDGAGRTTGAVAGPDLGRQHA